MIATNSPSLIVKDTPRNAWKLTSPVWYVFVIFFISIMFYLPSAAPPRVLPPPRRLGVDEVAFAVVVAVIVRVTI